MKSELNNSNKKGGLRAASLCCSVQRFDPGRKAVVRAPICEQQIGQMRV
jgi:hypothetical protein